MTDLIKGLEGIQMERRGQSQDSLEAEWAGLPAVRAVAQAERGGHERRVWGLVRGGERKSQQGAAAQASPLPRPSANTLSAPTVSQDRRR